MSHSPFSWFHKHQKHMLFILAVVLIVGWLIGPSLVSMLTQRREVQGNATILGKVVTYAEYSDFRSRWNRLFGGIFTPNLEGASEEQASEINRQVTHTVWGYVAAVKLADKMGIQVSDQEAAQAEREIFAQATRQDPRTVALSGQLYKYWLDRMRMDSQKVQETLREVIKFRRALEVIESGVQPTMIGAVEDYLNGHREYQLSYVVVKDEDFMKQVKEPTVEQIQDFYDKNCSQNGRYWKDDTYEVAYAAVSMPAISLRLKITAAEIEDYYNKNRDLYVLTPSEKPVTDKEKAPESKETPVAYSPLADVKARVETALRLQRTSDEAKKLMDAVMAAYQAMKEPSLEKAVAEVKDPAATYTKTGALTRKELMELPGIGDATADDKYFHNLVVEMSKESEGMSQVLTAPEKGLYVFRVVQYLEAAPEELDKVRENVILDYKRSVAAQDAGTRAIQILSEMRKDGSDFSKVVAAQKLEAKTTEYFRNSMADDKRPAFLGNRELTPDVKLMGPLRSGSEADRSWVIASTIGMHEATTEGFQSEMAMRLDSAAGRDMSGLHRELLPDGLLKYVGFEAHKGEPGAGDSYPMPADYF